MAMHTANIPANHVVGFKTPDGKGVVKFKKPLDANKAMIANHEWNLEGRDSHYSYVCRGLSYQQRDAMIAALREEKIGEGFQNKPTYMESHTSAGTTYSVHVSVSIVKPESRFLFTEVGKVRETQVG